MNISIFVVYCTLLLNSCNIKQEQQFFDDTFIQAVSRDTTIGYPPLYSRIPFFCQSDSNKILLIQNRELKELYDDGTFNMSYKDFLTKTLNQQMKLQAKGRGRGFLIDKNIAQKYYNVPFTEFINFYCENRNNNQYIFRNEFSENERNTIFYFLFINNYLSIYDDYTGIYHIRNVSVYLTD
jgi:hypothetical protein